MNIYIIERRDYIRDNLVAVQALSAFSDIDAAIRWLNGYFKEPPGPNAPDDHHDYPEWTENNEGNPILLANYMDFMGRPCTESYIIRTVSLDRHTEPFPEPSPYDGSKLREARLSADLSQEDLARRAGFRQKDISRWENNIYEPTASTLKRLAAAIGCSVDCIV